MTRRRGFTLIEVLIALVIMGVVTGAIYRLLNTNQRLSLAQAEQVTLQSNVRTGSLVVPNELRELNTWPTGTADRNDITEAEPDLIEYRAMRGLGFLCQAPVVGATELRIASSSWTGLRDPDGARDDLYLFADGDPNDEDDDTWMQVNVTAAVSEADACGATAGYRLTIPAIPAIPAVEVNTPVRLFERMELSLYADDGEWWLGARSVSAGEIDPQPMLGPLTGGGFGLEYLDSNGAATADKTAIKSIRLTVRGITDDAVRANGSGAMGHPEEQLVTQVLLRNSIRP